MKMKKLLLGLGTLAAVAAPVAAVVACGVDESKVNYVFPNKGTKAFIADQAKIKAEHNVIPNDFTFVAQTITSAKLAEAKKIDPSKTAEDFLPYIITETQVTDKTGTGSAGAPDKTREFTKGSAVNIIKTVVQYIKDLGADKADTFSIQLYAKIIQKDKIDNKSDESELFYSPTTPVANTKEAKANAFKNLPAASKAKYIKVAARNAAPAVKAQGTTPASAEVIALEEHYEDKDGNIVADSTGRTGSYTLEKSTTKSAVTAVYKFKAAPLTIVTDDSKTGTATLKIDLKGATEIKDITEKLIVVKASDKSTPNEEVKAEAYVVKVVTH